MQLKMNSFCCTVVLGLAPLTVLILILYLDCENPSYVQHIGPKMELMPKQPFEHFQNLNRKFACQVDVVNNLTTSGLNKIQNERKSRIRNVCDMCRRNRTSMECNHVTLDEDYHTKINVSGIDC